MNNSFLIVLISFSLIVFQFLLCKELLFLENMEVSKFVIPLLFIGYSIGSAISQIKLFRHNFNAKIIILISCAIILSSLILVRVLVLWEGTLFSYFSGLIWPFICFGIFFGKVYSESKDLRIVFLANGFGLMLGAIFCGKIFRFFGWDGGIIFICSIQLISSLFFAKDSKKLVLLILPFLVLLFCFDFFIPAKIPNPFLSFFAPKGEIVWSKNTELTRTDVVKTIGGEYLIFNDGNAPTFIFNRDNSYPSVEEARKYGSFNTFPYLLRKYDKALIIGAGGGYDLNIAILFGTPNIVGVELNPLTIGLMRNEFKIYSNSVYFDPSVRIISEEGRSYLQNTKEIFDLIILKGTDTGTTSSFVSSVNLESYLYTKEAIKKYVDVLSDDGLLFICRAAPKVAADTENVGLLEILRIYASIKDINIFEDISKHLVLIKSTQENLNIVAYSLLFSKKEFGVDDYNKLKFQDQIIYFPDGNDGIDNLWQEKSKELNVELATDNKPPVYNFSYWQTGLETLWPLVLSLILLCFIIIQSSKIGIRKGVFFMLLGAGYIGLEISLTERMLLFLRNPTYSMQVVLSSFLFFGGLGGYFCISLKKNKIKFFIVAISMAIIFYTGIFNLLYKYQLPSSQFLRIIFSFLMIGPIGFLSTIPFAIALNRESKKHILYTLDAIGTAIGWFLIFFIHNYFGFNPGFIFVAFVYLALLLFMRES